MIIDSLVRSYVRSGMRGGWRFGQLAARHLHSLQRARIDIGGSAPVIVDLRVPGMLSHLAGSPYAEPPWEPEHQALMRRIVRPGDVVYDVGANVGFHTVFLSGLVGAGGQVHAFEANPELHHMLRATLAGMENGTLHEFGLSDHDEQRMLMVPLSREMASLAAWTGDHTTALPCELRTLDQLVESGTIPPASFMKCDIEGAELLMLHGARQLLDAVDAPIILAEANSKAARAIGYVSSEIPNFLASLAKPRYLIFVEETPSRWVRTAVFPELNQYLLAFPEAQLVRWPELAHSDVLTIQGGSVSAS